MSLQVPDGGVTAIIAALSAAFAAVVSHFLSKPKQNADVSGSISEAAGNAVDTITDVLEHLKVELEEARQEIVKLREENAALRKSIASLTLRIDQLQKMEQDRFGEGSQGSLF